MVTGCQKVNSLFYKQNNNIDMKVLKILNVELIKLPNDYITLFAKLNPKYPLVRVQG